MRLGGATRNSTMWVFKKKARLKSVSKTEKAYSEICLEHHVAREEVKKIQHLFWQIFQLAIFVNFLLITFSVLFLIADYVLIQTKNATSTISFMITLFFWVIARLILKYLFSPIIEDQIFSLSYWKNRLRKIETMNNLDIFNSAFSNDVDLLGSNVKAWKRFQFGISMFWIALIAIAFFVLLYSS